MNEELKIDAIIAIDPGVSNGGIAVERTGDIAQCYRMPKDIADLRDLFEYYKSTSKPLVFLEKLSIRPDDISVQGGSANMGKLYRIQKMMAGYEHLKSILEVVGLPYVMVHPRKWMTYINVVQKGVKEEKADRKRRFKEVAGKLYPYITPTLWNADALLILQFGKTILEKDRNWVISNLPQREHGKLF